MNLDSFAASVRQFVIQRNPLLAGVEIHQDTDLIDSRIIDSLMFVEFILFLEDKFGQPVHVESGDITAFRSIASIYSSLSKKQENAHVQ